MEPRKVAVVTLTPTESSRFLAELDLSPGTWSKVSNVEQGIFLCREALASAQAYISEVETHRGAVAKVRKRDVEKTNALSAEGRRKLDAYMAWLKRDEDRHLAERADES